MATLGLFEVGIQSTEYHDHTSRPDWLPPDLAHAEGHHYCEQQLEETIIARAGMLFLHWARSGEKRGEDNYAWNNSQ